MKTIVFGAKWMGLILLSAALAGGDALAQRGDRGGGGRGGGQGRGGGVQAGGGVRGGGSFQGGRGGGFQGGGRGGVSGQIEGGRSFQGRGGGREFSGRDATGREFSGRGQDTFRGQQRTFDPSRGTRVDRTDSSRVERRAQYPSTDQARDAQRADRGDRATDRFGSRTDPSRRFDSDRGDRIELDRSGRFGSRFDFERYGWDGRDDDWGRRTASIRGQWQDWGRSNQVFRGQWWNNYGGQWPIFSPWLYSRWGNQPYYYWWGWTPANRLTTWLTFGWNRPYYWTYGPGRNIYYQGDYVYYDGRQVMPASDYYQYVYGIAADVPNIDADQAEQMDWQPLGVFAAKRQNETVSERLLQLAISQEGILSGSYYNRKSDQMLPLEGKVDERTQRATWKFSDGNHDEIVFETSIYNLTKSESTMMVHFGPEPEDAEIWELIRLEPPESSQTATQENRPRRNLP